MKTPGDLTKYLRELFVKWQSGEVDECTVHELTDELWSQREWPECSDSDPQSIPIEVLSQLAILNAQWIIKEDVPVILAFLETPPGQEGQAWKVWRQYWNTMDFSRRYQRIASNPYYHQSGPGTGEPDSESQ